MIAILAYWVLLFLIFLPAGILVQRIFKLNTSNIALTILLGMFFITTIFTAIAFFTSLGIYPFIFITGLSLLLLYRYRGEVLVNLKSVAFGFKALPRYITWLFALLCILVLFESAQSSNLVDNDTYYVQTIKWLNEYGFVKGLGNLHLFFAQTSGWHVLQAGLNLSFFTDKINDLNGFLFIICTWYYINESYKYWLENQKIHWLAIMPFFSLLLLMFIDSSSPDLPLLMVTPVLINLFLKSDSNNNYRVYFLLFVFLVFIKITIAPIALVLLARYNFIKYKDITIAAMLIAILWIAKNSIISGYLFYPFTFAGIDADWTIPEKLITGINNTSNKHIYGISNLASIPQKIWSWVIMKGIDGIFNKVIVILFLIMPFFSIIRHNKKFRILYIVMLIHLIALLITSPQVRFFLPEILFFSAVLTSCIINNFRKRQLIYNLGLVSGFVAVIISFADEYQSALPNSALPATKMIINPKPVSSLSKIPYQKIRMGNMDYYSPSQPYLLYVSGSGPLPCVNKAQIKRFEEKYNVIPQLRRKTPEEGFYSLNKD